MRGELLQAVKAACRSTVRELFDNDNSSMQLDAPALLSSSAGSSAREVREAMKPPRPLPHLIARCKPRGNSSNDSQAKTPPSEAKRAVACPRGPRDVADYVAEGLRPPPRGRLPTDGATSYKRNTQASFLDQEPLIN